ncbi:hypothetical protein KBC55_00930 [Patescibacteria group bacterium]|nr:hypothetical protein [Patescibacteria group bacterium]
MFIGLLTFAGYVLITLAPFTLAPLALALFIIIPFLFANLLGFEMRRPAFWVFLGTPLLFLVTSLGFFLLAEADASKWALTIVVTIGLALYAENLFAFYHLPSTYQAYSLEYLSLMLYIGSSFFLASGLYLAQLFLEVPLPVSAVIIFFVVFFSSLAEYWVSKIGFETALPFVVTGAVLLTQFYVALSLLPTGYTTNAAAFAIGLYVYYGLSRAMVLEKLTGTVLRRYAGFGAILLVGVLITALWS